MWLSTGDPTRVFNGSDYVNHPDHRAAAEAAVYAPSLRRHASDLYDLLDERL